MNKCIIVAALVCWVGLGAARATGANPDPLSDDFDHIMRTVLSENGYLTRPMHDEFWDQVRELGLYPSGNDEFTSQMNQAIEYGTAFQYEIWTSIESSLAAGTAFRTPGYLEMRSGVPRQSMLNAERLIEAAASGSPVNLPEGLVYLTPERVRSVLSGLDASVERFRRLFSPTWDETEVERTYPAAVVKIISAIPFVVNSEVLALPGQQPFRLTTLSNQLSATDSIAVGFARYGDSWKSSEQTISKIGEASLAGAGVNDPEVLVDLWRHRISSEGSGEATSSFGNTHVSVRSVEVSEHGGVITFIAISGTSTLDATMIRQAFEKKTQILRK